MGGHHSQVGPACVMESSLMAVYNHYIFLKTIPQCLDGSREWRYSSVNVDYGPKKVSRPTATLDVIPVATIVAVGSFFTCNLISSPRRLNSKSSLNCVVTYVTFIPSITVNSTLLNNIGVQQSCAFVLQAVQKIWGRWSNSSRSALIVSLFLKSGGEFSHIHILLCLHVPLGSQIARHGSSQPMQKDSQGCRQCGQTRNTTVIAHFPQR